MGILIGLANAIVAASSKVFIKKLKGLNPNLLTWIRFTPALPIVAILVTIFASWEVPPKEFFILILLVTVPLEIILAYIGAKALYLAPLSTVAPIGSFTSIFLIPVGYIFLGELPTLIGLIGVLMIVTGSFFIGWTQEKRFYYGLRDLFRYRGNILALYRSFYCKYYHKCRKTNFSVYRTVSFSFLYNLFYCHNFNTIFYNAVKSS